MNFPAGRGILFFQYFFLIGAVAVAEEFQREFHPDRSEKAQFSCVAGILISSFFSSSLRSHPYSIL